MNRSQIASQLRVLFEKKITAHYYDSFKGKFGRVQVEVLIYLSDRPPVPLGALAEALNIPKQHASTIISRLQQQGLVSQQPDPADKRRSLCALSPAGQELMARHAAHSNRIFETGLDKLSQAEQQQFLDAMVTLNRLLEKM